MSRNQLAIFLFIMASPFLPYAADTVADRLQKLDRNGDGRLSREEAPKSIRKFKFDLADRNKDGFLESRELKRLLDKLVEKKKATPGKPSEPVVPKVGQMRVVQDIGYQERGKDGKAQNNLDIYLPRDKTGFPVLFWIHGGGLHSGDKSKIAGVAARFVADGIGVVSANYRLYPEVKYPTQIEDVADAFAWVHRNIAKR